MAETSQALRITIYGIHFYIRQRAASQGGCLSLQHIELVNQVFVKLNGKNKTQDGYGYYDN